MQKLNIEEIEINLCSDCGEPLVCPKCTPVIDKTNSLIIRYKDTDYNGGYPNALIIAPLYTSGEGSFSVATLAGDNFYWDKNRNAGFTYIERGSVEKVANVLANLNIETWSRLFGFPKNRTRYAEEIKFRGKRSDNDEFVYGSYIDFGERCGKSQHQISCVEFELQRYYNVTPETVGQYTEQNDINGDDIYERMTVCQVAVLVGSPDIDFIGKGNVN